MKILVVDDDPKICDLLSDILEENGFKVFVARTTEDAWQKLFQVLPDLVLLDLEIPLQGGLEFCRKIKDKEPFNRIPVVFLTVRNQEIDKVSALNLGGDDFVTKPFNQKELLARIHAALRRSSVFTQPKNEMRSGSLWVDFDKRIVQINKKDVRLSPKEFDLLKFLYANRHRTLNKSEIFREVWGASGTSLYYTVHTHVSRLRKKLKEHGKKIKLVPGIGFRFDEQKSGKNGRAR